MRVLAVFNWGSLPGWLTVAALAGAAWAFARGGGGTAIGSLEAANRVLEARVRVLEDEGRKKDKLIGELQAKTDIALALGPVSAELAKHERQAEERNQRILTVLELIARRLGPDGPTAEAATA